jgi:hypothetical protein
MSLNKIKNINLGMKQITKKNWDMVFLASNTSSRGGWQS